MEPVNVAVIGCGMMARAMHIPNIADSRRMQLHTCCDLSDEVLAECQHKYGALRLVRDYREAIRDPNVQMLVLATTEKLRLPVIAAAADAGKPIYVEKPIAQSLEEMYQIQEVVHESGIPFCIGHNRRNAPAMIDAHRIFRDHMSHPKPCPWRFDREGQNRPRFSDDGVAGMSVRINDDWYSWKAWASSEEHAPFGPMLFEMTHFTDLCNWFLAAEPEKVVALQHGLFNSGVIIHYHTGEMATITMCANGTFGYPKELYECFGNGAAVIVDHMLEVRTAGIEGVPARRTYPLIRDRHPDIGSGGGLYGWLAQKRVACREAAEKNDPMLQFTAEPDKGHAKTLERFVDQIQGRVQAVCGVDDAVRATRVAFAAIRAAREKRLVRLDEV